MTLSRDLPHDGALYRRIVEDSPAAVVLLTDEPAARVLYASPRIEEISGFSARELLSQPGLWVGRLHTDEVERLGAGWTAAVERGERFFAEYRFRHRNGEWRWFRETSTPVREADGTVRYRQSFTEDITSERSAETRAARSEARYRELVEHLPVVVYIDAYGAAEASRYVSPNVEALLGHPAEALVADTSLWRRLVHPQDLEQASAAWERGWANDSGWSVGYRLRHRDGREVWVRDEARMVIDPATGEHTWQGVIVDLTAAKRSEDELRRSEERYRTLVEQVPAIVYEMGPDDERHTLYVSPHVEAILGYSRAEWLEQPDIWMELLDEEDRETELAAHDLHTTTRDPWDREYRLIASDGRRVWVRDQATLVQDPATGQARWYGVMLDLTAQKSAEEALRHANDDLELRVLVRTAELEEANEMLRLEVAERRRVEAALREAQQRYRDLVEDLPAVVYSLTTNWSGRPDSPDETVSLPYMSPAIEELVGFTPDEWQQPGFWRSRLHPHDRDRVCALADRSAATGEPFIAEYRFLAKDGRVVWVLDRATLRARDAQGLPAYFQGVMLDVTPRKEAEAKAEAAEERYRQLTERGPSATFVFRLRHGAVDPIEVEYVSPQVAEVIGHPLDHFRTDAARWFDIVHPDDRERVGASLRRAIDTGDPWALEYRIIRVDGSIAWLRNEARLVERDELGRPSAFQGALLDVSAERKPMEEIAASEVQLRSLIEGLHGIPWIQEIDPETDKERFTYIGAQSVDLLGYTPEELIAEPRHFSRMVHPDDRATVERMSARSRRTGIWEGTFRIVARDGSVKRLRGLARRTVTEDGRHLWHGLSAEVGPTLTPEDEAREHAQAGTGAASPEGRPSRPPVGGSPAER